MATVWGRLREGGISTGAGSRDSQARPFPASRGARLTAESPCRPARHIAKAGPINLIRLAAPPSTTAACRSRGSLASRLATPSRPEEARLGHAAARGHAVAA